MDSTQSLETGVPDLITMLNRGDPPKELPPVQELTIFGTSRWLSGTIFNA